MAKKHSVIIIGGGAGGVAVEAGWPSERGVFAATGGVDLAGECTASPRISRITGLSAGLD